MTRGRPRDEQARQAVLQAAAALLGEAGYDRLTIGGIAEAAGVSRPTLYRWWDSKSAIVAEAVREGHLTLSAPTLVDTGDLRADVLGWVAASSERLASTQEIVRALAAAAADNTDEASALYGAVTGPGHAMLVTRLRSAVAAEEISPNADLDAAASAVFAILLYASLTPPGTRPADGIALVIDGLRASA